MSHVLWRLSRLMNDTSTALTKKRSLINTQAWKSLWPHWPQHLVYSSKRSSSRSGKGSSPQKRSRSPSSSPERRQKRSRSRSSSGGRKRRRSRSRSSERFGFLWIPRWHWLLLASCRLAYGRSDSQNMFYCVLSYLDSVLALVTIGTS